MRQKRDPGMRHIGRSRRGLFWPLQAPYMHMLQPILPSRREFAQGAKYAYASFNRWGDPGELSIRLCQNGLVNRTPNCGANPRKEN